MKTMLLQGRLNVFGYANRCEGYFNAMAAECGYTRKTTFYHDLSIAEYGQVYWGEANAIKDTFERVLKEWIDDVEFITEFVLSLNWKSWEHANNADMAEICQLYANLYYKAYDKVLSHYHTNQEALDYIFSVLD